MDPQYVAKHFVPLALDTYFRGNSHELEFCEQAGAGGNHLVAVTAGGRKLGEGAKNHLFLRGKELAPLLAEFRGLPESARRPILPDATTAVPPKRPVPAPPPGGLILRGYCTYLKPGVDGTPARAQRFYYEKNPDRWAAETQSDMLWLTRDEARALLPAPLEPGSKAEVPRVVQQRFFSTIGIDYMEGSVDALPPRQTSMSVTVRHADAATVMLELDGYGEMGKAFSDIDPARAQSRGCIVRIAGRVIYNTATGAFTRCDIAGLGKARGSKMEYVRREIGIAEDPWMYGIACELVTGTAPIDRIPPYNMLHYGGGLAYFPK